MSTAFQAALEGDKAGRAAIVASEWIKGVYGSGLERFSLEELEPSKDGSHWLVTFGWDRPPPRVPQAPDSPVFQIPARVYKMVRVDARTGRVLGMKARELSPV
jgi:hypothetical protein